VPAVNVVAQPRTGRPVLDHKQRYLQVAFNYDLPFALLVLPQLPRHDRIILEAGTPFIKREGMAGLRTLTALWPGLVVADMKVADGAKQEIRMAADAGAGAVTLLGNAPTETLELGIQAARHQGVISMVDMIGVKDPLAVLRPLADPPDVVVLHKGRDEETANRHKEIEYRHVNRILSKFDVLLAAAGGVGLREARSAVFNGAQIVVVNLVKREDAWVGIGEEEDIGSLARQFLETLK
jgi:bifunctional enzyme Fae/Hps